MGAGASGQGQGEHEHREASGEQGTPIRPSSGYRAPGRGRPLPGSRNQKSVGSEQEFILQGSWQEPEINAGFNKMSKSMVMKAELQEKSQVEASHRMRLIEVETRTRPPEC